MHTFIPALGGDNDGDMLTIFHHNGTGATVEVSRMHIYVLCLCVCIFYAYIDYTQDESHTYSASYTIVNLTLKCILHQVQLGDI